MIRANFKNVEELKEFLKNGYFEEVKFCVDPDYIEAIIGISDEGKLVYDYDLMVEHLAKLYEGQTEDPYTDAMEWIQYNCDMPYWEISYCQDVDELLPELEGRFGDYKKSVIGMNTYGVLLLDCEYITNQDIDGIESILKEEQINYKII